MKAKDLAKLLIENPEFEVTTTITVPDESDWKRHFDTYKITGINDIGYSDKVIDLDCEKDE